MKVKAIIRPSKFACPPGRIKREGKVAETPFCYRIKVDRKKIKRPDSMLEGRVSVIELHSRVTGRKIGYVGTPPKTFVVKKGEAQQFIEGQHDRAMKPFDTPELVEEKMQQFLKTAQNPDLAKKATVRYRELSQETWKKILREAKK